MKRAMLFFLSIVLIVTLSGCHPSLPQTEGTQRTEEVSSASQTTTPSSKTSQKASATIKKTTASTTTTTTRPIVEAPVVNSLEPLTPSEYYGLSCLQKMLKSKALVAVYRQMAASVQNLQNEFTISEDITVDDLLTVFYYYRADYPQHFWCSGDIRYATSNGKVIKVTLTFTMNKQNILTAEEAFNAAAAELVRTAATGRNEYEREQLLHDALAKKVTYTSGKNAHSAYGALVEGKAVCEGYARAFQYLLYQAGIQCLIAEGDSVNPSTQKSEPHAWNVVRIDGQYYHTDLTWDDVDVAEMPVMYPYFNVTTEQIQKDHNIRTKDAYPLPNCTATTANYHVLNGTRLQTYTAEAVANILRRNLSEAHIYAVNGPESFIQWFKLNARAVILQVGLNAEFSYTLWTVGDEVAVRLTF